MLQIVGGAVLRTDDYCVIQQADGMDELRFTLSINDPDYRKIREEMRILETEGRQTYKVTLMDAGARTVTVVCSLDLDEFRKNVHLDLSTGLRTFGQIVAENSILPSGWSLTGTLDATQKCAIEMQCPTDLELLMQCQERFSLCLRFDNSAHTVRAVYPDAQPLSNAYIIDTVNVRNSIMYKGNSGKIITRLYPLGATIDGVQVTVADAVVGGSRYGKTYIDDNGYTDSVISSAWHDSRYEDAQSLYDAAVKRLHDAARPVKAWTIDVIDLERVNPQKWLDMDLSLFKVVRLIDSSRGTSDNVQIVKTKKYPYYPEKNVVSVSTVTRSVKNAIAYLTDQIDNGNSDLWQKIGG